MQAASLGFRGLVFLQKSGQLIRNTTWQVACGCSLPVHCSRHRLHVVAFSQRLHCMICSIGQVLPTELQVAPLLGERLPWLQALL